MSEKKIVLEIEIEIPLNFDYDNESSELRELRSDVKEKFEEIFLSTKTKVIQKRIKMQKYTEVHSFKISKEQKKTLQKLEKYNIKISAFIRIAIAEKIKRDYKKIKAKKIIDDCPF